MRGERTLTRSVLGTVILALTLACNPRVATTQESSQRTGGSNVPLQRVTREHLVFGPVSDSASIVRLAKEALRRAGEVNELSVHRFTQDREGTIVSLFDPRYKFEGGGGGLVWVDAEGWALLIKSYQ